MIETQFQDGETMHEKLYEMGFKGEKQYIYPYQKGKLLLPGDIFINCVINWRTPQITVVI